MKNLKLDQYISDVEALKSIKSSIIKGVSYNEFIGELNNLADFLEKGVVYSELKSLINLTDYLVDVIERINNGLNDKFEEIKSNIVLGIDLFLQELDFLIDIRIYFNGVDKYKLMNDKYIVRNLEIIRENSELESNDENTKKVFKVLIIENKKKLKKVGKNLNFDAILDYNRVVNELFVLTNAIYNTYYDYHFLSNELEYSKSSIVKNIIVGNSYPLTGIDKNKLSVKTANLSLSSQDLYYSYKLAKESISSNGKIERCIIGIGYYLTYHDLSRGVNKYSKKMISDVYKPLLGDVHNSLDADFKDIVCLNSCIVDKLLGFIFDLTEVEKYMSFLNYSKYPNYFNELNKRESISILKSTNFNALSEADKRLLGFNRAQQHNKLIKYSHTNTEFESILRDFLEYLNEKNVEAIFVIFPTTSYYSDNINREYKEKLYKNFDKMKKEYNFKIIDFNKSYNFDDSDFIDVDHLGESGCQKLTKMLDKLIN